MDRREMMKAVIALPMVGLVPVKAAPMLCHKYVVNRNLAGGVTGTIFIGDKKVGSITKWSFRTGVIEG